ncbi:hypothetical protein Ciccas_001534 [Cichlidogyrus casuarinus]|uniref:C2H2-type domain-containing protein n=1 Tax=Cichlidogyrus casuarinus TaxID=1844966 RepID=A0ABD2QKA1_9PLAT
MSSKSPKTSKKGSEKANSNKSDANKKVKEFADAEVSPDPHAHCLLCQQQFPNWCELQAHLLCMDHSVESRFLVCRVCKQTMALDSCKNHNCSFIKSKFICILMTRRNLIFGPSNRCLLCNGAPAPSRIHLVLHLICFHAAHCKPGSCSLCGESFTSVQNIDDKCLELRPTSNKQKSGVSSKRSTSPKSADKKLPKSKSPAGLQRGQSPTASNKGKSPGSSQKSKTPARSESDFAINYEQFNQILAHLDAKHQKHLLLETKIPDWELSQTKWPFNCPICGVCCGNNAEFHAHIMCCHSNQGDLGNKMLNCSLCGYFFDSMARLNDHVKSRHQDEYIGKALEIISKEYMQESADPSQTCYLCWQYFSNAAELQFHILGKHVGLSQLRCGHCLTSYAMSTDLDIAGRSFANHIKNHEIEFRERAAFLQLEFADAKQPLLPMGTDIQSYCTALCGEEAHESQSEHSKEAQSKVKDAKSKSDKGAKSKTDTSKKGQGQKKK